MTTWKIDGAHSDIGFKVKHLVISTVRGRFTEYESTISYPEEDLTQASISFTAQTKSITTGNKGRDEHLRSGDFFNSSEFPTLTFTSTSITKSSDTKFTVKGNLTMKSTTHEVVLDTTFNGIAVGMDGNRVASFEISSTLSRQDFGLTWNVALETGGVVVSDDIKLDIIAEFKEVK